MSIKKHLPYETVWGVVERRLTSAVEWSQYSCLGTLGLDEIARWKGHGDFIALVSARLSDGHLAILAVLPNRKKETLVAFCGPFLPS